MDSTDALGTQDGPVVDSVAVDASCRFDAAGDECNFQSVVSTVADNGGP